MMSYIRDRSKIYGKVTTCTNSASSFTKLRTAVPGSITGLQNSCLHKLVLWDDQNKHTIILLRSLPASTYQKPNAFKI